MSELVPRPDNLPSVHGGRPTFTQLAARITAFTASAFALKEGLWALKHRMERDAQVHRQVADHCIAAEVEPRFTALIHEAAGALEKVAAASGEVADAADQMQTNATDMAQAHESEYRGVYEAVNARPDVRQAKPGFYRTR